jgi:phage/plasmid-like protein (TIGR03299 family)
MKQQKYRITKLDDQSINTTSEAIIASGLDWEVDSGRLQGLCFDRANMQNEWRELPNHKCIYRKDTGLPLGNSIVGKGFELVQNTDAFKCFDEILQQQNIQFTSGGWFHDGGSVFLQAKLPQEVTFGGGTTMDKLERYLIMAQGHTGQQSLTYRFTHHRPSCLNTLMGALRDSTYYYSMKHTISIKERIDQAVRHMQAGLIHLDEVEKKFSVMINFGLSERETVNFLKLSYDRKIDEDLKDWRKWKNIEPIYEAPKGFNTQEPSTLWRAYNTLTEYEDHHSRVNRSHGQVAPLSPEDISQARQVKSLFADNVVNRKVKAFKLANEVISGTLDLKTGTRRTQPKEWVKYAGAMAGAIAVQGLML